MANVTPNMLITLPEVGEDGQISADQVTEGISIIDSHTHEVGAGVKIGVGGINIEADLELNGNRLTGATGVRYNNQAALLTGSSNTRTVYTFLGDLYYIDGSGISVKVTAAGGLATTSSGGFGGDYGAAGVGAIATYTDSSAEYEFFSDPMLYSTATFGDVYLTEEVAGVIKHVRLKSPASLAASYDVVFPAATPASTSLVTMDSSGNLATTRDPSVDTMTVTDLTITGDIAHGNVELLLSIHNGTDGYPTNGGNMPITTVGPALGEVRQSTAINYHYSASVALRTGDRIRSVEFRFKQASSATVTFALLRVYSGGSDFTSESLASTTQSVANLSVVSVSLSSIDHTILTDSAYSIRIIGGNTTDTLGSISVIYDRP